MFTIQVDDEIQLALLEKRHANELFELTDQSRNYLKQWLPWVDYTKTVENTERYIEMGRQRYVDNNGFELAIIYNGNIAGIIGLHFIDWSNKRTSIGYWLGEGYQGKGIMSRATEALTTYSFDELGMNRIEIRVVPQNEKSRAIPERLGYQIEGTLKQYEYLNGQFFDHYIYGMLKMDWGNRNDLRNK